MLGHDLQPRVGLPIWGHDPQNLGGGGGSSRNLFHHLRTDTYGSKRISTKVIDFIDS